ncbi:MAG: tetratricopeptide repeat protein [Trichodesmium sp. MO_231.B1]|nr:tetratricopeptide repeat protein [Trichodesmium sp. MO_231.B1]
MKIEKHLRLAKLYLSEGKLSQARATCKQILEIQPNSADVYRILGESYAAEDNFDEAMFAYTKALEIKPEYAEVHAFLGQLYSHKRWIAEAVNQYQKAIDLGLKWPELYYNLGNIKHQYGDLEGAINCYETAIILKPNYLKAYLSLGIVLELQRNYQAAVDVYRELIRLKPDFVEAYNNLGGVLADMNRTEEAVKVYQQALVLKPDSPNLYNNLGFTLLKKNPLEAIAAYHRAIELKPNFIKAHYNLGKALQIIGEHEWGVKYFQEVIRLKGEKDNVLVYSDCAFSLMTIGKLNEAFVCLQKMIYNNHFFDKYCLLLEARLKSVDSRNLDELYLTKVAGFNFLKELLKLENYSENSQQQYQKISQYLLKYYVHFGNVLMESQYYETAEYFYQRALQIQPSSAEVYWLLGNSLVKQKRLNSAIISYQIALQILLSENRIDEMTKIYFELGKVLEKQQRWQEAIDYYSKVLSAKVQLAPNILNNDFLPYRKLEGLYLSTKDWLQKLDGNNYHKRYKEVRLEKLATEYIEETVKSPIKVDLENRKKDLECQGLNCNGCLKQIYQWFNPKSFAKGVYSLRVQDEFRQNQNIDLLSQERSPLTPLQQEETKSLTPLQKEETKSLTPLQKEETKSLTPLQKEETKSLTPQERSPLTPLQKGGSKSLTSVSKEGSILSLTKDIKNGISGFYYFQKLSQSPTFVAIVRSGRAWIMPKKNYWRLCYGIAIMTPDNYLLADLSREYPSPLPGCTKHDPSQHQIFDLEELPPLEKIDGKVAVLSVLSGNVYFHWMVDLLPRIEILRQGINLEEIDWFVVNDHQQPFQRETLKSIGVKEEKILASDRHPHIQAKELVVPSYPSYLGWLQPWGLKFLREEFLKDININRSELSERIYVGRSNARYRQVINEEEVVKILCQFGFTYVTPESMSLENQIAIFAHAKIIIAPHGSGLTNIVFSNPGTKVIELFSPHYLRYYYWHISRLLGLEHYYLIGETFSCYPIRNIMYESSLVEDILVNLDSLNQMLKVIGIV